MYDAIIVGARCAGSATGMLLARKGYRVLMVDRATFPSDTLSTHAVKIPGCARLKRWGLLERVQAASNCKPMQHITLDLGPFTLVGHAPPIDGVAEGFGPRRTTLDKTLVDAAVEAGVELREAFTVDELPSEDGHLIGIRGHGRAGAAVSERARIVIGADGRYSLVARTVKAPAYNERPPLACWYYAYWSGVDVTGVELWPRPGAMSIAFPTNDDQTLVIVGRKAEEFQAYRADIDGTFNATLATATGLAERVRVGRRESPFAGTADVPGYFRKPYGPGWALVGDAGYHKDPITGWGISDAFIDAELLADALDAGFSGRRALDAALADYEQQRNERALPYFELTCQLAALEPPAPDLAALLGALVGNQPDTDRFLGAMEGTVTVPEFFAPENIGRIMAAGAPA
jgi:flavin-dependent dehydrogenase